MKLSPMEKWENLQRLASKFPKDIRYGQAMMSALIEIDKPLYQKLCGTISDCFYDDSKCTQFAVTVVSTWYEED
jgi:hypothetical protein